MHPSVLPLSFVSWGRFYLSLLPLELLPLYRPGQGCLRFYCLLLLFYYKVVTYRLTRRVTNESFTIIDQAIASHMCITECLPCEYIHVLEE